MSQNLFDSLKENGKLPTPPGVVLRVLELTRQPDVAVLEIAETLGQDPVLAAKVLRFANSPMAGVPREVNERAKQILAQLEDEHLDRDGRPKIASSGKKGRGGDLQLTLFGFADHPLLDEVRQVDLDQLTPLDAVAHIKKWQDELASES